MVVDYRYSWRNGALVKTDPDGNILSDSLQAEPLQRKESRKPTTPISSVGANQSNQSNPAKMEQLPEQTSTLTGSTSPIVDENTSSEAQSPEKPALTIEDLAKRDRNDNVLVSCGKYIKRERL